jgi:hypothetical protein
VIHRQGANGDCAIGEQLVPDVAAVAAVTNPESVCDHRQATRTPHLAWAFALAPNREQEVTGWTEDANFIRTEVRYEDATALILGQSCDSTEDERSRSVDLAELKIDHAHGGLSRRGRLLVLIALACNQHKRDRKHAPHVRHAVVPLNELKRRFP